MTASAIFQLQQKRKQKQALSLVFLARLRSMFEMPLYVIRQLWGINSTVQSQIRTRVNFRLRCRAAAVISNRQWLTSQPSLYQSTGTTEYYTGKKNVCKEWESSFVAILTELHPTWLYRKGAWLQKKVISPIKNAKYEDNKMLCLCEFSTYPRGKDASWSWLIGRADPQQIILACGHQAQKFVHLSAPTVKIIQSHSSRKTPPETQNHVFRVWASYQRTQ